MKKILPHTLIPTLVLLNGFLIFFTISPLITTFTIDQEYISSLGNIIINNPKRAEECGVRNILVAYKARNETVDIVQSGFFKIIIGSTLGIFIFSVSREVDVYKNIKKNS